MNNLILILIILINLIEPFMVIEFNNGLVFIKPENLSKTELVEKFKKLSSSKTLKELKNIKNKSEIVKNKSEIVENRSDSKIITSEIPSNGTELKNEKIVHDKTMGGDEKES